MTPTSLDLFCSMFIGMAGALALWTAIQLWPRQNGNQYLLALCFSLLGFSMWAGSIFYDVSTGALTCKWGWLFRMAPACAKLYGMMIIYRAERS